ncbi:MAG: lipopolysaccharide heptosyltransferase II [bacterium]
MAFKLLIRVPNHLGDCIMALPMVNEAREAHPGSTVTVLAPAGLAELYAHNSAVDAVMTIPDQYLHGWIAVFKIRDIIAPGAFDLGYVLPPSFGAASGFKLGGVKTRIGYIADGRRLLLSKPLPLPTPLNSVHRSETYFSLLRRGSGIDMEFARPKLFLNEGDVTAAEELLSRFELSPQTDYVTVAFRSVAESRRWGAENYTELVKRILSRYKLLVVLIGGPDDRREGEELVAAAGGKEVINLAGKATLRQSATVISRSRLFVGNDSGPAHLAAAVGVPLIVLSGADDPAETSPLSPRKTLIRLDHLDCLSCVKNTCPLKGDQHLQCMKGISVDKVMSEVDRCLSSAP